MGVGATSLIPPRFLERFFASSPDEYGLVDRRGGPPGEIGASENRRSRSFDGVDVCNPGGDDEIAELPHVNFPTSCTSNTFFSHENDSSRIPDRKRLHG